MPAPDIELRPAQDSDWPFLEALYSSTRQRELDQLAMGQMEKQRFVSMQFHAQRRHYAQHYAGASLQVITCGAEPIGRLYVDHAGEAIRIIDIALLPPYRGQGLGSALLRDVLAEAKRSDRRVHLHVEHQNPALRLYTRLGFHPRQDLGPYQLMEWSPDR